LEKRESSAHYEHELIPAAEEAARLEKLHTLRLRDELASAKASMEEAEEQAAALRRECAEAEALANNGIVQAELDNAEARNANLEEECAEIWRDIDRTRASISSARAKCESRSSSLSSLKKAVKDHVQRLMERAGDLDRALLDVPSGSTQSASQRSKSPEPMHASNDQLASTLGQPASSAKVDAGIAKGQLLPPLGNADPTISYPEGLALQPLPGEFESAHAPAKRRKLPDEEGSPLMDGAAVAGERQPLSSSPSPGCSNAAAATAAVDQAPT
jgi:hypothetical protein